VKAGIEWALAENARPGSGLLRQDRSAKLAVAGFVLRGEPGHGPGQRFREVKGFMQQNSGMFRTMQLPARLGSAGDAENANARPIILTSGRTEDIAYQERHRRFFFADPNRVPRGGGQQRTSNHGGDFLRPNGGPVGACGGDVARMASLRGDKKAAAYFTGPDCGNLQRPAVDGAEEEPPRAVTGPEKENRPASSVEKRAIEAPKPVSHVLRQHLAEEVDFLLEQRVFRRNSASPAGSVQDPSCGRSAAEAAGRFGREA